MYARFTRFPDKRVFLSGVGGDLKLRLGFSNRVLATVFSFSSKRQVGHVIQNAKVALLRDFVHHYLGFQHITRDEVIRNHTRALVKKLLLDGRDGIVLILDGTYVYCQKSANNALQ
ncbi:unnamed protein product [Didymodactylos carnosus]|uniref:Uncharacterized protein n=1 Tax=Didymodactylos carnosus TaxID=1234261 RepID=A0A814TCQ3_9BILA|nr:unnamed protein product [Didymodactylos carnosus]CAF3923120.1 unnamed protein product [Didymodactylos carnosus]